MSKRALLAGMGVWLTLLGLGILWITNPLGKPPSSNLSTITPAQTERAFTLRLAKLPSSQTSAASPVRDTDQALGGEQPGSGPSFDYEEWAFREMYSRMVAFFCFW